MDWSVGWAEIDDNDAEGMMAIWEKATLVDGSDPGSTTGDPGDRVTVDAGGSAWVRILSPSHRLNDGSDYTYIGFGHPQVIQG